MFYNQQVQILTQTVLPHQEVINRVIKVKQLMDNNCREDINLDYMARKACLSKYHFVRLFKRCYGITPHQYLNWVKVKQAKVLLQQGLSVRHICLRLNFVSQPSFTTLFKKHTGCTPTAYLQKRNFR